MHPHIAPHIQINEHIRLLGVCCISYVYKLSTFLIVNTTISLNQYFICIIGQCINCEAYLKARADPRLLCEHNPLHAVFSLQYEQHTNLSYAILLRPGNPPSSTNYNHCLSLARPRLAWARGKQLQPCQ